MYLLFLFIFSQATNIRKILIFVCLLNAYMTYKHIISGIIHRLIFAAASAVILLSCSTFPENELYIDHSSKWGPHTSGHTDRNSSGRRDKVFIVYSMGYNNLAYDLNEDIEELLSGDIPSYSPSDNALVIMSHSTLNNRTNYSTPTSPVLLHAYKAVDGTIRKDTIAVFPEGSIAATKEVLNEVLTCVQDRFPADHYGMLVSSHATGWAPQMYCYSPPDKSSSGIWRAQEKDFRPLEKYTDERPLTKSIGAHFNGSSADMKEIELPDFAEAIPFHLDFIIFDCCLMGGVEVAYELRNVCDKVMFSQTEILSGGVEYTTMAGHIFSGEEPDLKAIAFDYYTKYAEKTVLQERSATVSVVDCRKLGPVAEIVRKNAAGITALAESRDRKKVQQYFQNGLERNHGIFFDLEDMVIKSGAPESDLNALSSALDECIICRHATPTFLTHLDIRHHSGLSMYMKDSDREILNNYYTTLEWNKATGLITDNE